MKELSENIVKFFHGKTIALFTNTENIKELKKLLIKCIAECRNKSNLDQQKANIQELFSAVTVHFNYLLTQDTSSTRSFLLFFSKKTSDTTSKASPVDMSVSSSSSQSNERKEFRLPESTQECWSFIANALLDDIVINDELHTGSAYLRGAVESNHDALLLIHVIYTHLFGNELFEIAQNFKDDWSVWSKRIKNNLTMLAVAMNNPENYYLRQLWLTMLADNLLVMPADREYKNNKLSYLIYNFYFKMIMSFKPSYLFNKEFTLANPAKIGKDDFCRELLTLLQYMFMPLLQALAKIDISMYHLTPQRSQAWAELSGLISRSLETRLTAVSESVVDTGEALTAPPAIASSSTPADMTPPLVDDLEQDDVFESLLAAWILKEQMIAMALETSAVEKDSTASGMAPTPMGSRNQQFGPGSLLGHTPRVHTPSGQTGEVPSPCQLCNLL